MPKTKVEVYDKNQLIYPFIESDHVTFSNGMKVTEMLDQSISMSKVAHEDLSFKVGVGDQDVSSAIVNSSVAEMTIKGKTYQNILPEPSTHVLTNNKEMFKVNEGLDPNVEIVDGVSKGAILKGQTLVNRVSSYGFGGNNLLYESRFFDNPFQSGESLTIFVVNPNVTTIKVGTNNAQTGVWTGETNFDVSINKKITYTVPDGAISKYVGVVVPNALDSTGFENGLVILQGVQTHLDIDTYFEGMQSVKVPILTTIGKNLFDIEKVADINNWVLDETTAERPYGYYEFSLKPNTTYTFSRKSNVRADEIYACFHTVYGVYNEHGGIIHPTNDSVNRTTVSFTTDSNGKIFLNGYGLRSNFSTFISLIEEAQIEEGSVATTYDPFKSNILSTPEEVVLRGFDSVKDTLNLNTGEYVKCIGELTLDGSEDWQYADNTDGTIRFNLPISDFKNYGTGSNGKNLINNKLPKANFSAAGNTYGVTTWCNHVVFFTEHTNVNNFKRWLSQNPTTIQYELATPTIKTVDLSSSGNWEKIVLNGSENWNDFDPNYGCAYTWLTGKAHGFSNVFAEGFSTVSNYANAPLTISGTPNNSAIWLSIGKSIATLDQFKHYLSQNPVTVWYQTQNHLDSTQVKQPIFFKDGHVIQSSGADRSLIPTLDYQAKTLNSYVMDLMKANTRYTMKAKSASGTFTIDGTSYGAGTNGTFTTPSSMTNKLLVMSNKTNEEVMILEGDVTSKTIPYFNGIKSAFEGEDKIEVLSTGKNLFDGELFKGYFYGSIGSVHAIRKNERAYYTNTHRVKPNTRYIISFIGKTERNFVYCRQLDKNGVSLNETSQNFANNYMGVNTVDNCCSIILCTHADYEFAEPPLFQIEESSQVTTYEPPKSNSTKIPLLSPLRSLPDGTYDELIIDRMKKKATLIQRVGVDIYNGSEAWGCYYESSSKTVEGYHHTVQNLGGGVNNTNLLSNSFRANYRSIHDRDEEGVGSQQDATYSNIRICISRTRLLPLGYTVGQNEVAYFQKWLQSNPVTVLYPLLTPVVIEVDLEGFPYIYKDGHIFLNGEIAPTTEIIYSVNQCQQISASNEDIIRHEKELTYLQKLIAQYVQVDYESALLSLKV